MEALEIRGLSVLLDDDEQPPYLALELSCNGRFFSAVVLAAEEEWVLNVRDERGKACIGAGELYATQSGAILAAMLTVLESSRNPALQES